jgi:predicted TIM-barrel fold metal-dependent hydrolase
VRPTESPATTTARDFAVARPTGTGVVDYLCNSFLPDRLAAWEEAIAGQGIAVAVRRDPDDSFTAPEAMVARMDQLRVDTVLLVSSDVHQHPTEYQLSSVTSRFAEAERLAAWFPGRFCALWGVEPQLGMAGVRRLEEALGHPWMVGAYLHTHSFDRPFDHADHYPFYAACERAAVPMVVQAGASGGRMPSECGRAIGVDRPAIYFPELRFVLSHTGWPWVEEALAMALKFANVYVGTGSWPPSRWSANLVEFLRGPGRSKVLFGTNFPTVGHRRALAQLDALDLAEDVRRALLGGNARSIFTRLTGFEARQRPTTEE